VYKLILLTHFFKPVKCMQHVDLKTILGA